MTGDLGDSLFLATSAGFERQVGSGCVGDVLYFQFSLTTDPSISLLTGRILLFLHSVALLALREFALDHLFGKSSYPLSALSRHLS